MAKLEGSAPINTLSSYYQGQANRLKKHLEAVENDLEELEIEMKNVLQQQNEDTKILFSMTGIGPINAFAISVRHLLPRTLVFF